jgi:MtN3 and saliva related transmembrane protein
MPTHILAQAIGAVAACFSMASFAPQIIKIWRNRDASAVSLRTCSLTVSGFALWTAYGLVIGSWPVTVSNTICLAMAATVLVMKIRLDI